MRTSQQLHGKLASNTLRHTSPASPTVLQTGDGKKKTRASKRKQVEEEDDPTQHHDEDPPPEEVDGIMVGLQGCCREDSVWLLWALLRRLA